MGRDLTPEDAPATSVTAVELVEVGPRDGLQNEPTLLDPATRVELIRRLVDAGARRIEATSFVHPGRVPQMAGAEDVMAGVPRRNGVSYIGLALNSVGVERALRAGCDEVNVVVVATDEFNRRNQGMSTGESLAAWTAASRTIHAAGRRASVTIAAAFGCPFTGEVPVERVVDVARAAADAGPDELALADTIGVATPADVRRLLPAVAGAAPGVPLRIHLHNTRNTGYANAVAALECGVTAVDASVGGIGGCPFAPAATGNIATEDLAWMLERMAVATGVDVGALIRTGRWVGDTLGREVPGLLGRAGLFPPPEPAV